MAIDLLFFSRGRGHGHAIRDIALADCLAPLLGEHSITFASYATGAKVFRRAGRPMIDLSLPEESRFVETLLRADAIMRQNPTAIVISHEEFAAVVAAKLHGRPSIYLSSWLPPLGSVGAEALMHADAVMVFSEFGMFPELPGLKQPPRFVGPLLRRIDRHAGCRGTARQRLGIDPDAFLITVIQGGWATEQRCPLAPLLLPAFVHLERADRKLLWLAGDDHEAVSAAANGFLDVVVLPFIDEIGAIVADSDLVISKGNRGATFEAEELGIPSISVSFGTNRVDDILISSVRSNRALKAAGLNWSVLAEYLNQAAWDRAPVASPRMGTANARRQTIASMLAEEIGRFAPAVPRTTTYS